MKWTQSGARIAWIALGFALLLGEARAAEAPARNMPAMRRTTHADRKAAAQRQKAQREQVESRKKGPKTSAAAGPRAMGGLAGLLDLALAAATPDYFGNVPNYATSPLPVLSDPTNCPAPAYCGIRKFVDALPTLPIATPDTTRYPGSDYYEIELREYSQKFHTDLPATKLRGYVQVNGTSPAPISYLGPVLLAQRDRPVRVKFTNKLPTGSGGNLFLPTDTTYMGSGIGPLAPDTMMGTDCLAVFGATKPAQCFTENRATLHLHGGTTPWISDGTPHQWTTPAGETTSYPTGVSVKNVPDMDGGVEPQGTLTFFYSNQQSARLMFYHDHAYGITRLNVYAGEAAGYLLTDAVEQDLINGTNASGANPGLVKALPDLGIPLVIQDKTFVPDNTRPFSNNASTVPFASQLAAQDPTWDAQLWGGLGSLWFPHVYMPNQNPFDLSGANAMGRWDYGPWFWPPFTGLQFGPVANPFYDPTNAPWEPPQIPGTPNPSGVPEAFMDTPVVNGAAYPYLEVQPKLYRFRILNAANDRFWNLSFFVTDPTATTLDGRTNTEVKMVPFDSSYAAGFPASWGTNDGRVGGVPDPTTAGPAIVQIGTEGGFLPAPVKLENQPVNYNYNRRDITVLNVLEKALFLGPAERADILVDFSKFAGKTLILYNDSPAPVPAADPRIDYFTGSPDQTDVGGAPTTLAGYGPNTRTVLQIRVGAGADSTAPVNDYDPATLATLQTVLPAAFKASQDNVIVPQAPYNAVYGGSFPGDAAAYVKIQDTSYSFTPIGQTTPITMELQPKSIIEDFQMDYGRMNAILGVEVPHTNVTNQTSIIQGYIDPPTEVVKFSNTATPIGTTADGTQLWKITHNGVDTHAVHFHMFNLQLVNRIGWDGAIKPPDANELGWKETIRTNPLEDIVVALRPISLTNVPFKLPNSVRPLDVTRPLGSTMGFINVDPLGNPVTVTNELTNFGWEFVWHCHLLGHEENDMMRAMVLAVAPEAPSNLVATQSGNGSNRKVNLTWVDNSLSATSFTVQRATNGTFTSGLTSFPLGKVTAYSDPVGNTSTAFFYRVFASNTVGSTVPNYPTATSDSGFSNVATVTAPPPQAPTNLVATLLGSPLRISLTWTDNATNETGFVLERSTNGGPFLQIAALGPRTNTGSVAFVDSTVGAGNNYRYRVAAVNATGTSSYATSAQVNVPTVPAAPSGFTASAVVQGGNARVTLRWTDNSNNETGFTIQRATNSTFTSGLNTSTVGVNTTGTTQTVSRGTQYWYRIQSTNAAGASAWVNATPFPITTP